MALRFSNRKDWIDNWFGGLARRSNELPCPSRWEVFVEAFVEDIAKPLANIFRRRERTDAE